jgi:hypothetical protein
MSLKTKVTVPLGSPDMSSVCRWPGSPWTDLVCPTVASTAPVPLELRIQDRSDIGIRASARGAERSVSRREALRPRRPVGRTMCLGYKREGRGPSGLKTRCAGSLIWLADVELTLGDPFRALQLSEDSLEGA